MSEIGKGRNWSVAECEYLEESWGVASVPTIAKNLDRSVNAVKEKAGKLKLGPALQSGEYITLNQLLIAVTGKTSHAYKLTSWVEKRGFPVHTKRVNQCSFRVVYINEFWEWAEKNRSFIDFSRMEPLILGEEPAWIAEQRKKDFKAVALQRKDAWTPAEDARLKFLLKQQKYGYAELSDMLKRSAGAIQRRCTDLKIKDRPVKAENHGDKALWTDEMYDIIASGICNGDSYNAIARAIGKSEKAVRGKCYTVYLTENADKIRKMINGGKFGDGAPDPTIRQAKNLSKHKAACDREISLLLRALNYRRYSLGYEPYWQKNMCMHWNDFKGCEMQGDNCDACTEFVRIQVQYCARCGSDFYERAQNRFCSVCRKERKKKAQRHWARCNSKIGKR